MATYDEVWRERFGDPRQTAQEARTAPGDPLEPPPPPATVAARRAALAEALSNRSDRVDGYVRGAAARREARKATTRPLAGGRVVFAHRSVSTADDHREVMTR